MGAHRLPFARGNLNLRCDTYGSAVNEQVSIAAGDTVIAEPNAIVPVGVIPPDAVKTPGVLVDHLLIRAGSGGQIWTAKN